MHLTLKADSFLGMLEERAAKVPECLHVVIVRREGGKWLCVECEAEFGPKESRWKRWVRGKI